MGRTAKSRDPAERGVVVPAWSDDARWPRTALTCDDSQGGESSSTVDITHGYLPADLDGCHWLHAKVNVRRT